MKANHVPLIWTLMRRELIGFFASPIAYVFIIIFLLLSTFFTFARQLGSLFVSDEASLTDPFFSWLPWLGLILVPAIGMRLWSEEKRQGTLELLLTFPIHPWHAVVAKFLASWLVLAAALFLTFPLVLTIGYLGDPDYGVVLCGYLGALLLLGSYLAVTSLTSALTRNQIVAFIISVVLCLFMVLAGFPPVTEMIRNLPWLQNQGWLVDLIASLSVVTHFNGLIRGVVDSRDLIFFVSLMIFGLAGTATALQIERRK